MGANSCEQLRQSFFVCLRGELTGSRLVSATAPVGRFAPADPWIRKWFPRRSSADGSIARHERPGILARSADDACRRRGSRRDPLRAGQPRDRVPQCAGADREPDLRELGRRLRRDPEDVPAGRWLGPAGSRRGRRDARGLLGLAQALVPGSCRARRRRPVARCGRRGGGCRRAVWRGGGRDGAGCGRLVSRAGGRGAGCGRFVSRGRRLARPARPRCRRGRRALVRCT